MENQIKPIAKWIGAMTLLLMLSACPGGDAANAQQEVPDHYEMKEASRDGIGKFYMGREISHVMGHRGANWLERPERVGEEKPDDAVAQMDLKPTDVVADIGAGTGYFSFRISPLVPEGRVLAVDIQRQMLTRIERRAKKDGITNVEAVLGSIDNPNLPTATVDVALMVDAYHEFSHPREMMLALVDALKPGGRIILLEYRLEDPSVPIKRLHRMSEVQVRKEMAAVGLTFVENRTFLPQQHFLVFQKPAMNDQTQ